MDLSLTAEQEMLKSAVQRFIQQEYPKETLLEMAASEQPLTSEPWQKLVDTGWLGIMVPEEYGGEGGSLTDAAVLFEELGRRTQLARSRAPASPRIGAGLTCSRPWSCGSSLRWHAAQLSSCAKTNPRSASSSIHPLPALGSARSTCESSGCHTARNLVIGPSSARKR